HELGSKRPGWPYPSDRWVKEAEQLAAIDIRLSAVLQGKAEPKDTSERLGFAHLCQMYRKRYAAADGFYVEAFAAQPALSTNLQTGHRYNAACAAAQAGCGQGEDAATLGEMARLRWRRQALTWLRADLRAWSSLLAKEPQKARPTVVKQLRHW